jgi:hypothetical protein
VNDKENSQKAIVVNSEPFVSSLGGKSSRGGKDGRDGTGNGSNNRLWLEGVQGSSRDSERCWVSVWCRGREASICQKNQKRLAGASTELPVAIRSENKNKDKPRQKECDFVPPYNLYLNLRYRYRLQTASFNSIHCIGIG